MLVIDKLRKSYGPETVLRDVSLTLDRGTVAGLIGANGTGKTTLFKVITGIEEADSGRITWGRNERIGYLPQAVSLEDGCTIDDLFEQALSELRHIENRLRELEALTGSGEPEVLEEYGELSVRFEDLGGYDIGWRQEQILEGMGLGKIDRSRVAASLSGGEKTRLSLAMLLLSSPDILLLDEPTNNLDFGCFELLEKYIGAYHGGVLIASHDRHFLNATVNRIYEIDENTHEIREYPGNYADFKAARDAERKQQQAAWESQQLEIRELQKAIRAVTANPSKKARQRDNDKILYDYKTEKKQQARSRSIRSAKEQLERIKENPILPPGKQLRFKASPIRGEIRSDSVLQVEDIEKSYDGRAVLRDANLSLRYDTRLVITGANGTGKTTLLRILTGEETPDAGKVRFSTGARVSYLRQEPDLPEQDTVLEWYARGMTGFERDFIFDLVTTGLFRFDDIRKSIRTLSLGQKRKLELARVIVDGPNVLLLDEPTNHFSLDVIEELESALAEFKGPVLAVSHDREFIRRFDGEVWELADGRLVPGSG